MARPLYEIAKEIERDWRAGRISRVSPHARPYLDAMKELVGVKPSDNFGHDDAKGIVLYFLSNAATWRGPVARRIKAELKEMVK